MGFAEELIAPCGVNCGVCIAYLRKKSKCCSCMISGMNKPAHCNKCRIKFCDEHEKSEFTYCYECSKFPCTRLRSLDKRYVEKNQVSLIQNSTLISENGLSQFLKNENEKWKCEHCCAVLCVHRKSCLNCGREYR